MDENSIPFAITIDFDSLTYDRLGDWLGGWIGGWLAGIYDWLYGCIQPQSATLRERDSTHQVRIPVSSLSVVNMIQKKRLNFSFLY
jgi:glycyl-tRNA synthetase (class II)